MMTLGLSLGLPAAARSAPFFAPDAVWNVPVDPAAAVDANSPTMIGELTREAVQWGAWINTTQFSTPLYTVPQGQPTISVTLDSPPPLGDTAQRVADAFSQVPMPPGAAAAAGSDGHLVVWQPSTDTMWEFWRATQQSDGWHAKWGGKMTAVSQSPGYFQGAEWSEGATATSLPLMGGLMTIAEQQSGHIDHALAFALPAKYNKFVFPAIRGDGRWGDVRAIPEGARLRLDPSFDITKIKLPYTRMIAQAAQRYGIIVRDYATVPAFFGEDPTPLGAANNPYPAIWGNPWPKNVMAAFPWSSLQVLALNYDTTPPASSTIASGPPARTAARTTTFRYAASEPTVTYQCKLDTTKFNVCEPPTVMTNIREGSHTLLVRAVDPSGNIQAPPYDGWTWTQDSVGPVVTFAAQPRAQSNDPNPSFDWTANEPATYECQADGAGWSACSAPHALTALADGAHGFSVRGTDDLGNVGVVSTVSWTVDTVAPTATIQSGPVGVVADSAPTFTFDADETAVTFECLVDGGSWTSCSSPHTVSGLSDGPHDFSVRATDAAGNRQTAPPHTSHWTQDTTGPLITVTSRPAALTNSTSASIDWTADEPATYECEVDGAAWSACTPPQSLTGLTDGAHDFSVRGTDALGNVGRIVPISWIVDTIAPTATFHSGPVGVVADTAATFTFDADESAVTFECMLDGATWTSCSSPATLGGLSDGWHELLVRATDAAGNLQTAPPQAWDWTQDTTGPVITVTSRPAAQTSSSSADIDWTADEPASFECQVDGAGWNACSAPESLTALADGAHDVSIRATDGLGNLGSVVTVGWTVDTIAPTATILSGPSGAVADPAPIFTFDADESAVTFECELDGGAWTGCGSPHTVSGLSEGPHDFAVRATDAAGNLQTAPPQTSHWTQDTIAPVITVTSRPAAQTRATSATIDWTADEQASFECDLDGAGWSACSAPATITGLADGAHGFSVRATDAAGNLGSVVTVGWAVDATPPTATIQSGPSGRVADATPTFTFVSDEAGSTFECRLDGGAWTPCSSPAGFGGLAEGPHSFAVRATDPLGNAQTATPDSRAWIQDTTGPQITYTSKPAPSSATRTATFDWTADEPAGFECMLDAGSWTPCTPPHTLDAGSDGPHTFTVRATDALGNMASGASITWSVDTTPPTTTITSGPSGYVPSLDATFNWTSNEPSSYECRLDAGAWSGCSGPGAFGHLSGSASFTGLTSGSHTFEVRSTDALGNVGAPDKRTWTDCTVEGTPGNDVVTGTPGNDVVCGLGGNDTLIGGAGDDRLIGGSGDDVLQGGGGADVLIGDAGLDTATYADHTQPLRLSIGDTTSDGQTGEGDDIRAGVENVVGGSGDDAIYGDANANVLDGGAGNDRIVGGAGNDQLLGAAGADVVQGDGGADVLSGGAGIDQADYSAASKPLRVSIADGPNDGLAGEGDDVQADVENILGGKADDTLVGSAIANWISGGTGNDTIVGGKGQDTLLGNDGNDTIDAFDATKDSVTCGNNADSVKADVGLDAVAADCETVG